jgi:AcrR family transcriptional regulator
MRARLLAAARDIAVEDGWQAVTIRRIADRLEYTSPILYQHFAGKDALLRALAAEGFREIAERLEKVGGIEAIANTYWDFAFEAPELYQVMHGLDGVPFGTDDTPEEARKAFALVRRNFTDVSDPDGAVDTVWAFLHGFVSLAMSGRIAGGRERARGLMIRAIPGLVSTFA